MFDTCFSVVRPLSLPIHMRLGTKPVSRPPVDIKNILIHNNSKGPGINTAQGSKHSPEHCLLHTPRDS